MAKAGYKCDICKDNSVPPQPSDVVELRRLLGPQAKGYAHPACMVQAQQEQTA